MRSARPIARGAPIARASETSSSASACAASGRPSARCARAAADRHGRIVGDGEPQAAIHVPHASWSRQRAGRVAAGQTQAPARVAKPVPGEVRRDRFGLSGARDRLGGFVEAALLDEDLDEKRPGGGRSNAKPRPAASSKAWRASVSAS